MEAVDEVSLKKLTTEELIKRLLYFKNLHEKDAKDFEEYKTSSQEMELMMEREIEDAQREAKTATAKLHQLTVESERAHSRHEAEKKEFLKIEEALRKEVTLLRGEQETNKARIRELEQKNDDLERHERNNQQEVTDLEQKINEMTERLTLLENELAEKQTTTEEMYRLREEMRAAERPLLMVGPLRAERQDDTPEEPTPGDQQKQKPQYISRSSASVESDKTNGVSCGTRSSKDFTGNENSEITTTPLTISGGDGKGFASCVNRIVKDLMLKVDRLEGILTGLRVQPVRR
ncbi:hypothetical protein Y032_0480g2238 [Ancylostoma ceylanicum]|uniref:NUDE domain-containing protein n=1 Tax=Ancylostoma ceylanicum TaxID=53326 RepID=A0A016WW31_9BILA|nr:hypothetical protein Y032_0480g2238 [Ancylostoma ceylanicum]